MGGWLPESASNHNEAYDPSTDRWQEVAPLPQPLSDAAVVGADDAIYLFGGFTEVLRPSAGAWRYDPSTDRWDKLQPLPAPRGGFSAAVVAGKIYAVGGHARLIQELSTLEAYDISNDRWETLAPMPTPRVISAAGVVRSKIVVAGGLSTRKGRNLNANEIYDPIADELARCQSYAHHPRRYCRRGYRRSNVRTRRRKSTSHISQQRNLRHRQRPVEHGTAHDRWPARTSRSRHWPAHLRDRRQSATQLEEPQLDKRDLPDLSTAQKPALAGTNFGSHEPPIRYPLQ